MNFIFKNQKTELNFNKDDTIQNVLSTFAEKVNIYLEDLNFLYSGEKLNNNESKKLSDLNDKDNVINISVYEKKESEGGSFICSEAIAFSHSKVRCVI